MNTDNIFTKAYYKTEGTLSWRNDNKLICKQFCKIPDDTIEFVLKDVKDLGYNYKPTHFLCESFYCYARGMKGFHIMSVELRDDKWIVFDDGIKRKLRHYESV